MRKKLSIILLSLCFFVGTALAKPTAMEQLSSFSRARTISADFVQEQHMPDGRIGRMTGNFLMVKPAKFRWEYKSPYEQLIISDGQRVWFYEPDLKQVIIRSQSQIAGDKPILLLSDPEKARRYFDIQNINMEAEGLEWLEAIPKNKDNSTFLSILIGFLAGEPQKLAFRDAFNNQTVISFSNIRLNRPIDAQRFIFIPPAGVDVLSDNGPH